MLESLRSRMFRGRSDLFPASGSTGARITHVAGVEKVVHVRRAASG